MFIELSAPLYDLMFRVIWAEKKAHFEEMMSSGNVVQEKAEITKIHKFEFLSADVAFCVSTLGAKFSYKGNPNDYLPTVTSN